MNKPIFFISSTIFDFKDLRSSLKYFLEQQGCVVLTSESNDFPKPLEDHSYEACLKTLESADYFILLIGTRVGGWYNVAQKISITKQEYLTAYQLHLQRKLKIITFVRDEVWQYREDRKELEVFLKQLDLDTTEKLKIINRPSNRAEDADFICNFISEVSRNEETKIAVSDASIPKPTGNWVHSFNGFRDLIDTIQAQVFIGRPIEYVTLNRLLLKEIDEIIRLSLIRFGRGNCYSPETTVDNFYLEHPNFEAEFENSNYINVMRSRLRSIASRGIYLVRIEYKTLILEHALKSSAFLSYDNDAGKYMVEPIYDALYKLYNEISEINKTNMESIMNIFKEDVFKYNTGEDEQTYVRFDKGKLILLLYLFDRWSNIVILSRQISIYLRDGTFSMPILRPRSPVPRMNAQLLEEFATDQEIEDFIYSRL